MLYPYNIISLNTGGKGIKRKSLDNRKQEVFNAIAQIISQDGIAAVSTKKVAEKLGISQPAIYRYFSSRDDMLLAFIQQMSGLLEGLLDQIFSMQGSRRRIEVFYTEQLKLIEGTELLPKMLFFEEFHIAGTALHSGLNSMVKLYEAGIRKIIDQGIAASEILECDTEIAVIYLKGAILTLYLDWVLDGRQFSLPDQVPRLMKYLDKTLFI